MTASRLSLSKRLLFGTTLALLSVTLLFGALETALRLGGYGHHTGFFRTVREADGSSWIRENRDFGLTYFAPELVRRPQAFRIPARKAPGTYRIFVLGSSAAMGDPEASFSMARTLATMLRAAYPTRTFEVVNAAMTAINSHVDRAIAADCAQLEPDLFIVYEGHNEVIGPFGPAAVLAPFLRSRMLIQTSVALKRTRTGQLISALARGLGHGSDALKDWGGMGMFLHQQIRLADPRLDDTRRLFAANLHAMTESAARAGARTLLCTVLTNEKDFAPFLSQHRERLTADDLRRWDEAYAAGNSAFGRGDVASAEASYRAAATIDPDYAELAFRLGRLCLAANRDREAREFLQHAVDADALRFRTDSRLNETIRAIAATHPENVDLVDLAAAIATQVPHGIVGDETLYEHVHLTFHGTWEVARILFTRVSTELVRRHFIEQAVAEPLDYEATRTRLGYTVYEQAMIARELLRRFAAPPFTAQSDQPQRVATWRERAEAADRLLQRPGSDDALVALYDQAWAATPNDWVLARNFGMVLVARQAPERGLPWLEKARAIIDDDPDTLFALATALHATGQPEQAREVIAKLRQLEPRYPGLPDLQ